MLFSILRNGADDALSCVEILVWMGGKTSRNDVCQTRRRATSNGISAPDSAAAAAWGPFGQCVDVPVVSHIAVLLRVASEASNSVSSSNEPRFAFAFVEIATRGDLKRKLI